MVAKFNSKAYLQKSFPVFSSRFVGVCLQSLKKMQYGYQKNAEFDSDFESVEKPAKHLMRKSYQRKVTEKWSYLTFITACQSISSYFSNTHNQFLKNNFFADISTFC
jgi:hypothetical protein